MKNPLLSQSTDVNLNLCSFWRSLVSALLWCSMAYVEESTMPTAIGLHGAVPASANDNHRQLLGRQLVLTLAL